MLPKINRLSKENDFKKILHSGKDKRNDFLILKFLKNNLEKNRFGFVIGKKVSNKATVRNKVKRRLRDSVRDLKKSNEPLDIVIIALPKIVKKEFSDIREGVVKLFSGLK